METYKLTAQKIEELRQELQHIEEIEAPRLSDRLDQLRTTTLEEFDTSVPELLEAQAALEKRRKEIELMLSNHQIINPHNKSEIDIGSTVTLKMGNLEVKYQIVETVEADPLQGKISRESVVGKALLGKKKGDKVEVDNGLVVNEYEILSIG